MKSLRISVILTTIIIVAFLCSGFAAALNQDEASAQALFSSGDTLQAGKTVTVTIYFTSTAADELQITNVGIHFDWLPSGGFLGYNLSSPNLITIPSGGGSQALPALNIKIPDGTTAGSHSYYIEIDGTQGNSSTPFFWDSASAQKEVIASVNSPTPTNTNSGGAPGQMTLLLLAVVAVVVVVAVLMLLVVMRKKRTKPKPAAKQSAGQPEAPAPEKKPETGQDFNI